MTSCLIVVTCLSKDNKFSTLFSWDFLNLVSNWSYCRGSLLGARQVQFVDVKWVGVGNEEPNCCAIRDPNLPDCRPITWWVVSDFSEINVCPCKHQTLHEGGKRREAITRSSTQPCSLSYWNETMLDGCTCECMGINNGHQQWYQLTYPLVSKL